MLEELEARSAAIPESELGEEIQDLLRTLREKTGKPKKSPGPGGPEGSLGGEGEADPGAAKGDPRAARGAVEAQSAPETLLGIARERYPDVAPELARYYLATPR